MCGVLQVLESQLQSRRQRELDLERQVASLQAQADKLGGAVSSADAAASRASQLEQQVRHWQQRDKQRPGVSERVLSWLHCAAAHGTRNVQ